MPTTYEVAENCQRIMLTKAAEVTAYLSWSSDFATSELRYREPDGRAVARHVRPADAEHILTLHEDLDTALSLLGEITSYDYWRSYPVGLRTRAEDFIKPYDQEEKRVFDTQKLFYARIPGEEDASKAYLVKGMLGDMPFDGCGKPYAFSEKESKYLRDMGFETEEAK